MRCFRASSRVNAGNFTDSVGWTIAAALNTASVVVRLRHARGTANLIAGGAITVNTVIQDANDGKIAAVGATATENCVGICLDTATADGDAVECVLFGNIDVRDLS